MDILWVIIKNSIIVIPIHFEILARVFYNLYGYDIENERSRCQMQWQLLIQVIRLALAGQKCLNAYMYGLKLYLTNDNSDKLQKRPSC